MGDDSEWLKLPTEDKCIHKAWKARIAGYEEALKVFQKNAGDEKSPEFSKYLGIVKKFVIDNNAIAQEKGLDAVLAFVENAAIAGKSSGEVCSGVIAKCLNASRAKTKEKGIEILLMYIEIEKHEIVLEALMGGLANKQPKIVAACVLTLKQALSEFGSKVVPIKPMVKQIQRLLEDRDQHVREMGKQLVVEIYRWIGAALKPQLANLKPVQITELESEFANIAPGSARQCRFLRSQQDLKAKMEEQAAAAGSGEGAVAAGADIGVPEEVDPYDLMDPVEILSKLPKDYYEKIEAKKWQERKEALEAVHKLAESPKIEGGDFHDLVKTLRKVVAKDSNVMLVTLGAKVIACLASGLRKKFSSHAAGCVDAILEKFKEKKPMVLAALREAIDAVYLTTTLDSIQEMCVEALGHKTPGVKAETAAFLARSFARCTPSKLPKKLLKGFVTPLLKTINDTAPEVREASFNALGTAMKVLGEKPMIPFLADIDSLKMAKVKEYYEKAELIGPNGQPRGGGAAPATAAPAAAVAAPAAKKPVSRPGAKSKEDADTGTSEPSSVSAGARPKTAPAKTGGKKGAKSKKGAAAEKEEKLEVHLSDEAVEEKASTFLPSDVVPGLANANWKERLAAMEKFTDLIKRSSKDEIPTQVCVRVISKKPGLKENNFQVMKLKVELLSYLGQNSNFSKTSASYCITDLVDKVGDVKNGSYVQECLSCVAESTSLEYVSNEVILAAFAQKNPKNQSEALLWLSRAIKEFGFKLNVKLLVETLKKALANTNPAVRTAAITVLGVMYIYMGATLRVYFDSEKAALLQQIDAEFDKVKGEKPPPATRGATPATPTEVDDDEDDDEGGDGGAGGGINVADLVPRNDISEKLTDDLMTEMADKNWKIRKETLEKVIAILNEAKFITPNIGSLPESLKLRLADSNKILVTIALNICQALATSMGPKVKEHIRIVGPGIVGCLGDSKPGLRVTAVATLNAWIEQTGKQGFIQFVEAEIFSDALKLENPNLRAELLGWLAEKLPTYRKIPSEINMCLPYFFLCLEDRNGDVRKKGQECVIPFMIHTGYEYMAKQAGKLKPSSKTHVMKILEDARPNLPKKEPKVKPQATAAAVKVPSPVRSESPDPVDDDVPERPSTAPSKAGGAPAKGKGKAAVGKKGAAPPARKKKDMDEDLSPPLKVVAKGKEQRFKDERNLKALKWNFATPRGEYIDQLKQQMETSVSKTIVDLLFHADFKNHIKAIDILSKVVEECEPTIANLDMILKWSTLRFFDTNTSVILKVLEYLQLVFNMLSSQDYHMMELEAVSFVPYLINKVGDPKDNIRKSVRDILHLICKVYPASKMFNYLLDGLKSKNSKQKTECLDELGNLIEVYGINVCQPSPAQALKIIAQQINTRDNTVRMAALNTIVAAYNILGDMVYKYIGNLNDKDAGMLEERIKRSGRTKPAAGTVAAPPQPIAKSPQDDKKAKKSVSQTAQLRPQREDQKPIVRPSSLAKEYQLDADEMEASTGGDIPSLVEHNLDDLLNEPVKLPERKIRPPSPTVRSLLNSADAKSTLDLVISHIASNDINTSIEALAQVDGVLKDEEKAVAMMSHVDQLLVACTLQLRMSYSKHMSEEVVGKGSIIRLYKCLLGSLLALFEAKNLAKNASQDVLRDLIHNLITILLDNRLNDLDDGPQVVRSVNVMVVKIVEKSDHTAIMSALIKLLHETIGTETASPKFVELIMKGLWKMVRMLPEIINDLQVEKVILDLHQFLKTFPSHTWKQRPNDMPLRTAKTILHSLAKLKGAKILTYLDQVDGQNSEVEAYLCKVLKNGLDGSTTKINKQNEQMNGTAEVELRKDRKEMQGSKSTKRLSKSTHDMLAEIFKKIGSKENTREGLNDLFDFKQKYPEADLEPFLKKSSQFFQSYIERGLKNIEIEREGKMKTSASAPNMSTGNDPAEMTDTQSATTEDFNPSVYMERLKVLRARCGLDNSGNDLPNIKPPAPETLKSQADRHEHQGSNSSLSSSSSGGGLSFKSNSTIENISTDQTNSSENSAPANVSDLKKRLQRIKAQAGKN